MAYCGDYEALMNPSWFSEVHQQPITEQFYIEHQFKKDDYQFKLDLAFPVYRDEELKPCVFSAVRTAEKVLARDTSLAKEYLPPFGYDSFCQEAVKIILGDDSPARIENRAFAIQTLSATGAIRVGGEFLAHVLNKNICYFAEQSVDRVRNTFSKAGFTDFREFQYFNRYTLTLDIDSMLRDLKQAPEESVVFLQASAHNPTGHDPTQEDWKRIAQVMTEKRLFPFFASSFQGFASGDLSRDAWPIRHFASLGMEMFCAQSFSKNFNLYNERVGALTVVLNSPNKVTAVKSHLMDIVEGMYASPPSHGARIVAFILGDKTLREQWTDNIASIAERLRDMRLYLREELERLGAPGTWVHITNQVGNFCFTGFNELQVQHMRKQHHIYMLDSGRLTISGINPDNVEYIARAMNQTLIMIPPSYILKKSSIGV